MLEKVVLISFISFYTVWFGYNFVANRDEIYELEKYNTAVVFQKWPTWFITVKLSMENC